MNAQRIIARLAACGITVTASGNALALTPPDRVTPTHAQFVRQHKAELLAALRPANDFPPSIRPALRRCCDCIHGSPALAGSAVSWHSCAVPKESRWHGQWGLSEHYCGSWEGSVAEEPADPLAASLARLAGLDLPAMLEGQLTEPQWDRWGDAVAVLSGRLDDEGKERLATLIEEIDARWVANRAQEARP